MRSGLKRTGPKHTAGGRDNGQKSEGLMQGLGRQPETEGGRLRMLEDKAI